MKIFGLSAETWGPDQSSFSSVKACGLSSPMHKRRWRPLIATAIRFGKEPTSLWPLRFTAVVISLNKDSMFDDHANSGYQAKVRLRASGCTVQACFSHTAISSRKQWYDTYLQFSCSSQAEAGLPSSRSTSSHSDFIWLRTSFLVCSLFSSACGEIKAAAFDGELRRYRKCSRSSCVVAKNIPSASDSTVSSVEPRRNLTFNSSR